MLFIQDKHEIIESSLKKFREGKDYLDINFCDFGETRYHLWTADGAPDVVNLSISLPSFRQLNELDLISYLGCYYGPDINVLAQPEPGFVLSLSCHKDVLSEELIGKLSLLRMKMLTLPLKLAIEQQSRNETGPLMAIPLRSSDAMYVQAQADRITVIFATKFDDPSDAILGKVFMQELYDTRQQNKLQNAPAVLLGKVPPKEVASLIPPSASDMHYITFILFPNHYTEVKRDKCFAMIANFRDYFHYHIKCCKAYLHTRMRAKVDYFLKILNRAKFLDNEI